MLVAVCVCKLTRRQSNLMSAKEQTFLAAADLFPLDQFAYNTIRKGSYPVGNVAVCCNKKMRAGEAVIAVPYRKFGKFMDTTFVHVRCMREHLDGMPKDRNDIERERKRIKRQYGIAS